VNDFAASIAHDCQMMDNMESVTYSSPGPSGTATATVADADCHEMTADEQAALGGFFGEGALEWTLWAAQLAGIACKPGDYLTRGDGSVWHVKLARLDDLKVAYNVVTVKDR